MANSNQKSGLEFLKSWGGGLTNWTERWIPDALVIVWILSIITFIMALIWGDVGPAKARAGLGKRLLDLTAVRYADVPDHDDGLHTCLLTTGQVAAE
ncbi:MAG: hypothetical protein ABIN18_26950 [Pseudomonadota bacterium]